jgi:hypothetical protein
MTTHSISNIAKSLGELPKSSEKISPIKNKELGQIFSQFMDKAGLNPKSDLYADLSKIGQLSNIPSNKLLSYQIKANQFHLQVEMLSKVAESALATARKLQQNQ